MFEQPDPEINSEEIKSEKPKNLEKIEEKQEFTKEGTPEINADISPEEMPKAAQESIEMQVVNASQEDGKRRVGKLGMAGLGFLALMSALPVSAEARGKHHEQRNVQRIEHVYKSTTRHEVVYGRKDSWKQVARDAVRGALFGNRYPAYGGYGGQVGYGYGEYGGGYGGYYRGGYNQAETEAIRQQGATQREYIRQQYETDREAIRRGRGVPYDARPERQPNAPNYRGSGQESTGSYEYIERAGQGEIAPEQAESLGSKDGAGACEVAKTYQKVPILTKGRLEHVTATHQGTNADAYRRAFIAGWIQEGGNIENGILK